jgi:hypothetical protein
MRVCRPTGAAPAQAPQYPASRPVPDTLQAHCKASTHPARADPGILRLTCADSVWLARPQTTKMLQARPSTD